MKITPATITLNEEEILIACCQYLTRAGWRRARSQGSAPKPIREDVMLYIDDSNIEMRGEFIAEQTDRNAEVSP